VTLLLRFPPPKNFEISFELDTSTCVALDKAGLLVVFGVGLRGLGGVEAPVFIDLQRITGILRSVPPPRQSA